jgi:regulator of sigma E protease
LIISPIFHPAHFLFVSLFLITYNIFIDEADDLVRKRLQYFMILSLMYVFLAIFGLSILIFVHELGHYFMARRVGMRVETFAIGFGRPIYSWERNGVKWQVGWLLFGGYVKIAGQDVDSESDPYEVPDGFFGKRPIDRIKVAFMGPFVNLLLAFLIFVGLWATGGREKNFSEFTHVIGWVDPHSELYALGLRPGDEILAYNQHPYQSFKDHLYVPMTSPGEIVIKGLKVNYATEEKTPYEYKVKTYPHPSALEKGILTSGIINSANYIIYDRLPNGKENALPEGSPLKDSGIEYGDRVLWVDGEVVFSSQELNYLLNDGRVLLTIVRDGQRRLVRVPRVLVQELKMDSGFREELMDWQYEAALNGIKLQKLYTIPYNLTNDCVVENELKFIDRENGSEAFPKHPFSSLEEPLKPNDKIIAIDGKPVDFAYELLGQLQEHQVNIIVERDKGFSKKISWKDADSDFDRQINWGDIQKIAQSIGNKMPVTSIGNYQLLRPVIPKMRSDFTLSPEKQAWLTTELLEQKKEIESIEDPEKRAQALHMLQDREKQLLLGLPGVQDRKVSYNPTPIEQFTSVFSEIWRTLGALLSGSLNPKWISGPIGIVQVVHDNWMISLKEALFWLGAISLNLGVLNLLPIPVLDGGTIAISFFELITGKRVHPKTLEKVVIPFAMLLIAFFIFVTYQDLSRIFGGFFH